MHDPDKRLNMTEVHLSLSEKQSDFDEEREAEELFAHARHAQANPNLPSTSRGFPPPIDIPPTRSQTITYSPEGNKVTPTGKSPAVSRIEDLANNMIAPLKWVKGDLIGRGTYGRVYLAMNTETGELITVKQIQLPTRASDQEDAKQATLIEAVRSEIGILQSLKHVNIVEYLGWSEEDDILNL
jgi:hypothetical protein